MLSFINVHWIYLEKENILSTIVLFDKYCKVSIYLFKKKKFKEEEKAQSWQPLRCHRFVCQQKQNNKLLNCLYISFFLVSDSNKEVKVLMLSFESYQ